MLRPIETIFYFEKVKIFIHSADLESHVDAANEKRMKKGRSRWSHESSVGMRGDIRDEVAPPSEWQEKQQRRVKRLLKKGY